MILLLLLQELKIVIVPNKKMKHFPNILKTVSNRNYKKQSIITQGKLFNNLICMIIKNPTLMSK
jgi:hypothetical protein